MAKARRLRGPIKAFGLVGPIKAHELAGGGLVEVIVGDFADIGVNEGVTTGGYFDCSGTPIPLPLLSRIATSNVDYDLSDPADTIGLIFENARSGHRLVIAGCGQANTLIEETPGGSSDFSGLRWDGFASPPNHIVAFAFTWSAATIPPSVDWQQNDGGLIYQLQ